MSDQTRYGIDEIISENHAKKYQADTRKKFEKWLEECPVMYAHIEFMDENIVSYKFKITKRRNK
jgi:hypothetical protein|tara:strand:- start:5006 stop:5197 length:192 start_codon:yes stop_codon:yes gene_type:complete